MPPRSPFLARSCRAWISVGRSRIGAAPASADDPSKRPVGWRAVEPPSAIREIDWDDDGCSERCADQVTAFTRVHLKLFLAIDNRPRLKQHSGHSCCSQHDKLVVSVDAHIRVDQFVLISAHDGLRVLTGELQASVFQFLPEQAAEQQASVSMRILVRDENRVAAESVAEMAFLALEFPTLEQRVRHGIVMDRNKEICR